MGIVNKNSINFRKNIDLDDTYMVLDRTIISKKKRTDIFHVFASFESYEDDEAPIGTITEMNESTETDAASFTRSYDKLKLKYTNTQDKSSEKEWTKDKKKKEKK